MSVLLSEPRAGVFSGVRSWLDGELLPRTVLAITTSLATTTIILSAFVRRIKIRQLDDTARILIVALTVFVANALISFPYTKDEIQLPAGAFYALAAYAGIKALISHLPSTRTLTAVTLTVVLTVLTAGWTVRAAGLPYYLRSQEFKQRNDWAYLPRTWGDSGLWPSEPAALELTQRLRDEAVAHSAPHRLQAPWWAHLIWEN